MFGSNPGDYFLFSTDSMVERDSIFGYKTPRRLRNQSGKSFFLNVMTLFTTYKNVLFRYIQALECFGCRILIRNQG
ncbi:hypothetical protein [Leptospira borgpetersenii]|uniref:hypothetical protein n=1 Tax=Leptospira borgpetersenii TaxID=174 RepID=UPI000B22FA6E|nr:hypothetical protein [Leptospira borgpetersenii]MBE8400789.1 hypothetical protein [Leptospira borgpetersenii serovar Tarassovi]MBE8403713.1 hypothetical protein [Leptospira borgpetersenii serovar Tarassovi]MBE8405556.1 hypothetical protein [Leptospira borgpetersenii serovar Tarassovi]MBE8411679.1 hypothetical protein [Leptospira borgpetersenii serovar Tarassovi]MBE8416075.1 hypothetical protein [Leptospira borgpetersenii serovar Tarassovi]